MTFQILAGGNALAIKNSGSVATAAPAVRSDDLRQDWFELLRTPIEIGLVLLRIVKMLPRGLRGSRRPAGQPQTVEKVGNPEG